MSDDLTREIARTIWETSRRDEGTISVTGANIIAAALAPVMRETRAQAWDDGYRSGYSNAMRWMSDEPTAPTTPNPYRAEEVGG